MCKSWQFNMTDSAFFKLSFNNFFFCLEASISLKQTSRSPSLKEGLSVHLMVGLSIHRFFCLSISPSVHPLVHPSAIQWPGELFSYTPKTGGRVHDLYTFTRNNRLKLGNLYKLPYSLSCGEFYHGILIFTITLTLPLPLPFLTSLPKFQIHWKLR